MASTSNIMNTNTAATEIGVSLKHGPIVDRTGLLSLILSDEEWAAYAPNRVDD